MHGFAFHVRRGLLSLEENASRFRFCSSRGSDARRGPASAQSVSMIFKTLGSRLGTGFGDAHPPASRSSTSREAIAWSCRARVSAAGVATGNPANPLYTTMLAASANEAGYRSAMTTHRYSQLVCQCRTFFQLGTFVNQAAATTSDFPPRGRKSSSAVRSRQRWRVLGTGPTTWRRRYQHSGRRDVLPLWLT